jgi:uncharacterized protein (DUF111 family)
MKKGRPGTLITVLADESNRLAVEEALFRWTTTFGLRRWRIERSELDRELKTVRTPLGQLRVKIGSRGGKIYTVMPEYESLKQLAAKAGLTIKEAEERIGGGLKLPEE